MSFPTRPENAYKAGLIDSSVRLVNYMREVCGTQNVAICGGFPRDMILGAQPRDVDMYLPASAMDKAYKAVFADMLVLVEAKEQTSVEYQHQYIEACVEAWAAADARQAFLCLENHKINLVFVSDGKMAGLIAESPNWSWAQAMCSRFNVTTSQMYINDVGEVRPFSDQVITDVRNRECTILRNDWGREGTVATVNKFLAKYPDWKVFVCNDLGARYEYNEQKFLTPGGPCGRYEFDDGDIGF
ncbi:nucleotidyltransferase [Nostoc phage NMeng1]|nr:nucleotidyltransferase [Nostoc phage NMeng1]